MCAPAPPLHASPHAVLSRVPVSARGSDCPVRAPTVLASCRSAVPCYRQCRAREKNRHTAHGRKKCSESILEHSWMLPACSPLARHVPVACLHCATERAQHMTVCLVRRCKCRMDNTCARVVCALCVPHAPHVGRVAVTWRSALGNACAREGGMGGFPPPTTHDGPLTNR
jgi:hypothetical protein